MKATCGEHIKLTRGVPPEEAFPTERLVACCQEALTRWGKTLLQYCPSAGFFPLREALAEGERVDPEQVLVGNGSLQLLAFLCEVVFSPGDAVVVERPSYDRAITTFRRAGLRVVGVPLEDDGVDLTALEVAIRTHSPRLFYVIPDFQNPTGITTSLEKRRAIVELAHRYRFIIVEDIPYRRLRYFGDDVPTFRVLGREWVVQLSSFSKLLSPGLRVGWLVADPELTALVGKVAEDTYITPGLLGQGIAYEFIRRGWLEENVRSLKDLYRPRLKAALDALSQYVQGGTWPRPEGGFFVGVWLPEGAPASRVAQRAREEGLILSDSAGFFADRADARFVRIPFCALTEREVEEAIRRLARAVNMVLEGT